MAARAPTQRPDTSAVIALAIVERTLSGSSSALRSACRSLHEAAPVPRQQQEEEPEPVIDDDADTEAANTIRPEKPENPMDEEVTKRLPPGTCKATNEKLKGDKEAQKQWDRWCDVRVRVSGTAGAT